MRRLYDIIGVVIHTFDDLGVAKYGDRDYDGGMSKQLTPKIRYAVLKRDKFTCQYCGRKAPEVQLHVEHKKAVINGGANSLENLVASCATCNHGKYAEDYKEKHTDSKILIKRTYRITLENEEKVKRLSNAEVSESEIIRNAISAL